MSSPASIPQCNNCHTNLQETAEEELIFSQHALKKFNARCRLQWTSEYNSIVQQYMRTKQIKTSVAIRQADIKDLMQQLGVGKDKLRWLPMIWDTAGRSKKVEVTVVLTRRIKDKMTRLLKSGKTSDDNGSDHGSNDGDRLVDEIGGNYAEEALGNNSIGAENILPENNEKNKVVEQEAKIERRKNLKENEEVNKEKEAKEREEEQGSLWLPVESPWTQYRTFSRPSSSASSRSQNYLVDSPTLQSLSPIKSNKKKDNSQHIRGHRKQNQPTSSILPLSPSSSLFTNQNNQKHEYEYEHEHEHKNDNDYKAGMEEIARLLDDTLRDLERVQDEKKSLQTELNRSLQELEEQKKTFNKTVRVRVGKLLVEINRQVFEERWEEQRRLERESEARGEMTVQQEIVDLRTDQLEHLLSRVELWDKMCKVENDDVPFLP